MFQPRRRLGKLSMAVSVVFLIAALYTLFFHTTETLYGGPSLSMPQKESEYFQYFPAYFPYKEENIYLPYTLLLYAWPYRWLSLPLAVIGVSLFLTGLLAGFYDDISEIFY